MLLSKEIFPIGPIGTDGNACPVVCPAACGTGQMNCYAGLDANGCLMPETCAPTNGSQLKSNSFQKTSFKIMYPFMSNLRFLKGHLFYELAQEVHEIYIIREPHKPLKQVYKIAANLDEHIILVLNWLL